MTAKIEFQGNETETIFCLPFSRLRQYRLTDDGTKTLINISFASDVIMSKMIAEFRANDWVFSAMEKRINALSITIEDRALVWLRSNASSVGIGIMYLYFIQYKAKLISKKHITFDDVCMFIFPDGFPSQSDLQTAWDSQKCVGGNMLDFADASKSIMF